MRLTELDPHWVAAFFGGPTIGILFECPHCRDTHLAVYFVKDAIRPQGAATVHLTDYAWSRTGDSFENLTLTPSIDASAHGHWHGFITNGAVA